MSYEHEDVKPVQFPESMALIPDEVLSGWVRRLDKAVKFNDVAIEDIKAVCDEMAEYRGDRGEGGR